MKKQLNKQHGPWLIKKREIKYQNPWIKVKEDKVIQPDGTPGIFGTVELKKGISVLPLDKNGFVYLTREFHYALGDYSLEVVSGTVEKNESYLEAAKRELDEELGIKAGEWTGLGRIDPLTTIAIAPAQLFLARKLTFNESNPDNSEIIKMVKIKFDEAVRMVMESKITHAQSCALILKAKEYLN